MQDHCLKKRFAEEKWMVSFFVSHSRRDCGTFFFLTFLGYSLTAVGARNDYFDQQVLLKMMRSFVSRNAVRRFTGACHFVSFFQNVWLFCVSIELSG